MSPMAKGSKKRKTTVMDTLKETEARFRCLFENMMNAIAIYRVENDGSDFIFVDFNRTAEKMENTNREDVIGKNVVDVFPGVVDFGLLDVFRRVYRTGTPEHFPISFYTDDRIAGWRDNYVYKLPSGEIVAVYSDETERKQQEEIIQRQTEDILNLSTPILQIWEGIIVAPCIGVFDSHRAKQFTDQLLTRIVDTRSAIALIDITGVPVIDTLTAQHLIETFLAVKLLGTHVMLTGVRPAIAQTLVQLGIDLGGIDTGASLSAGFKKALMLKKQIGGPPPVRVAATDPSETR